jgi:hypothetical protein
METQSDEFCVSMRIFGDNLDPAEVTDLLRCNPSKAARTGDVVTGRSGRSRRVRRGYWLLSTEASTVDLEEQIVALLARVTADGTVWQDLTRRFDVDLFCGVFSAGSQLGVILSPRVHRLLAERNLTLCFDIYGQDSPTDVS